jgi:hypothetical protein
MSTHIIKEGFVIYKGEKSAEAKYRKELSQLIREKYGEGPYKEVVLLREIVTFSLAYYVSKFKAVCQAESSLTFYQNAFWLHEQATEFVYKYPHKDGSSEINRSYVAKYRRVLKYILETGCETEMVTGESFNEAAKQRYLPIIDNLLFLGDMIFACVQLYAEQAMIDDVVDITFDRQGLYVFGRRHHYDVIFEHFNKELGSQLTKSAGDEYGIENFVMALNNCFAIRYEDVSHTVAAILQITKQQGDIVGIDWNDLPSNLHNNFGVPEEIAKQFFAGLTLDRNNKMDLLDLACRPYQLNRYLYRPILIWNIDGKDYAHIGENSWTESIHQYVTNAIPWGKAPAEWTKNKCFKDYVHRQEDQHDKWLDDIVEDKIKVLSLPYDRNSKQLNTSRGPARIDVVGLGEIDFIIVVDSLKKILIADCKHLRGRYDMADQKNDYNAFAKGSKNNSSYNQKIATKVAWFDSNKTALQEHFQFKYPGQKFSFSDYEIEGIFIVNTPTFYMFNAEYRIYTVEQVMDVLTGNFTDRTFMIVKEDDDQQSILNVSYPYFRKPDYIEFDPFAEE